MNLKDILSHMTEEKMNLAEENSMQGKSNSSQTSWGWSAAESKSWSWSDQSWSK